jgi:molybdate transport system substrate-binding protein
MLADLLPACLPLTGLLLTGLLYAMPCRAADLLVLSDVEAMELVEALAPGFEKASGHRLHLTFADETDWQARLRTGEHFDIAILPAPALAALVRADARLLREVTGIARAGMGIAARADAAKPPLANVAQMREVLLGAGTIAVARESLCGERFLLLLETLGVAEQVAPRLLDSAGTNTTPARLVAGGRADLGIEPAHAIATLDGVRLLAPWPPEVQCYETLAAAVSSRSRQAPAVRAFLRYLTSEAAGAVLRAQGREPVPAAKRAH